MYIEDRETPQEPTYLPEAPAFDGFAEALRAFKISGITSDAITVNTAVARVKDRELETAKDQARDSLLAQIAGQALSPELKAELQKRIESALGSATNIAAVRAIASNMSAEIREAGDWSGMEKNLNDQQTREERLNQIWNNIDQINNDISKEINIYLTDAEKKQEARLKEAIAKAESEKDKETAERALLRFYKAKGIELEHSSKLDERKCGAHVHLQTQKAEDLLESSRIIKLQDKTESIIGLRDTKAVGSIFDAETELGNTQKNTTASLDKSTTKVASIFDEPETGNLIPNIPPQSKGPGGGRSV